MEDFSLYTHVESLQLINALLNVQSRHTFWQSPEKLIYHGGLLSLYTHVKYLGLIALF